MVHSKNYKRLQHNSCKQSYRNSISRANQGQKFTKKQLSKLTSLSKRQRYEVMITRLMYAKTVRTDRKIEYNVLQKINDKIKSNILPEDILRHIKSFIPTSVLVKAKLNITNCITMDKFTEKVLSIDSPNRNAFINYFWLVRRKVNIYDKIEREREIYSNPSLRFVKYKDEVYDIRTNRFNMVYTKYVEEIYSDFEFIFQRVRVRWHWEKDYYLKSYNNFLLIKENNILEERERLETLLRRSEMFGHDWAMHIRYM